MNGIFAPGEEALFVSPSPNLTGATLDLTGAVVPVSFTGAFGTIFLSPTLSTLLYSLLTLLSRTQVLDRSVPSRFL